MFSDLSEATAEQLLASAEECGAAGRELEVGKLEIVLAWADLHSGDPQDEPGAASIEWGGPRLISVGGDGTPQVSDLALAELAVARSEHVFSTRRVLADAFDLRHRLPSVWAGVRALECEVWVARKVASMSRRLTAAQVVVVDEAVAAALGQAPGRILAIAEAKVIEADPEAHQQRIEKNKRRRGVWFPRPVPGESVDDVWSKAGIASVIARIDEADALAYEQIVDDLATALAEQAGPPVEGEAPLPMDHWRAEAFAMLADPAAVLAFLNGPGDESEVEVAQRPSRDPRSPSAELVVHLSLGDAGVFGPVARVEGLGPRLLAQVQDLLVRHPSITVVPVIDLHAGRSVNGYEHPSDVKRRTELRTVGDVFPHATAVFNRSRRGGRPPDHDHTRPYDKDGPPGQTGDHNDTPLGRHHHRVKTHAGYSVFQIGPDRWVWGTPHGLYRLVSSTGTTRLSAVEYRLLKDQQIVLADDFAA